MAPFTVLEASGALSADQGATVAVRTPSRARAGLHLIAFVAWPPDSAGPDFEAAGWEVLGDGEGHGELAVLRRATTDAEPAFYTFAFVGSLDVASPPPMVIIALVTGAASDGLASSLVVDEVLAGGPDFDAIGAVAAAYSDAAFSVFYAASPDGFIEDDATILEVHGSDTDDADDPVGGSMLVMWEMPEAAGAIGERTATLDGGDPCDGTVAQCTLRAAPPAQAPRWDTTDTAAIGLPTVGV